MTFEAIRDSVLLSGGKARRPEWGDSYVQFRDLNIPKHNDMLYGSDPAALFGYMLGPEDILAEDWEAVA